MFRDQYLAYKMSEKSIDKNFNSDLFIKLIQSVLISLYPVYLYVLFDMLLPD